ncbi:ATP-binding protein [Streptomyces pseudogriseolus]
MSSADLSDTALVVLDDEGTVTAWTLAARRLTGHTPGEAVGRTAARILPGVADRLPARDGRPGAARIRHRDGRLLGVTLLLARTRALGPDTEASWTLDGDPRAVRTVRTLAARRLAEWGLDGLVDVTELIVSELTTNAVRHGGGPVGLRLLRDKTLTVEVSDGGAALAPHPRLALTTDEGGRGLHLVAKLSRRWGVRPVPGGKVVWAELDYLRPPRTTARALPAPAALDAA